MRNLIPEFIHNNFKHGRFSGQFSAVSLFVDISGFTPMTEKLMQRGMVGAEILAKTLLMVFDPLVNAIYAHDGIITGFAGDAFTALFPFSSTESKLETKTVYRRAFAAAYTIHRRMADNPYRKNRFGTFFFGVKVGVASGDVEWEIRRSVNEPHQYIYYFRGSAIDNCAYAEHKASSGDLIIARLVYYNLQDQVLGEPLGKSYSQSNYFRIKKSQKKLIAQRSIRPWEADPNIQIVFLPPEVIYMEAQGEFRHVVSVFISLKDIQDNEQIDLFSQRLFPLLQKYRGRMTRFDFGDKGCNLLLFWGTPIHFENDLERALNFLLDLKEDLDLLRKREEKTPIFRAGVTSQQMYSGYVGGQAQGEFSCYGPGVILAARMMMGADWDDILLSQETVKLIDQSFNTKNIGTFSFKGFKTKKSIYRLMGRSDSARSLIFGGLLIGRDPELKQLHALYEQTAGASQSKIRVKVVTIYGDAGMGKSHLVFEFRQQILRRYLVWWLYCPSDEILHKSLQPFIRFLSRFFNQRTDRSEDENEIKFNDRFNDLVKTLKSIRKQSPLIEEIISELNRTRSFLAAPVNLFTKDSLFTRLDPKLRFENLLIAFINLVKGLSFLRPVVISIEDLHWIDDDSKILLKRLVLSLWNRPVLIICTSRYLDDGTKPKAIVDLKDSFESGLVEEINLGYLARQEIKTVAELIIGGSVGKDVVEFLQEKTGGNPFFVEQMTFNLMEQGVLKKEEIASNDSPEQEMSDSHFIYHLQSSELKSVPANISNVLISRLDRLPLNVKQVVQTASVLGPEFSSLILKEMLMDSQEFESEIEVAVRAIIWRAQSSKVYAFNHALMRDAAYDMQLRSRLQELHKRAAQTIENIYSDDLLSHLTELGYHYDKAGMFQNAIFYYKKAVDQAKSNYQNKDALTLYSRLLSLMKEIKNQPEQLPLYVESLYNKGKILLRIGQWDQAETVFLEIASLVKEENDPIITARVQRQIGWIYYLRGMDNEAMDYLNKSLELSASVNDLKGIAFVNGQIGKVYLRSGEYEKALICQQKSLSLCNNLGLKQKAAFAGANVGEVYYNKGHFGLAEMFYRQSSEIYREAKDQYGLAIAYGGLGRTSWRKGDYPNAMQELEKELRIMQELGDRRHVSVALEQIGAVYSEMGKYDQALEHLQQSLAIAIELGDRASEAKSARLIGAVYRKKGDFHQAIDWLSKKALPYTLAAHDKSEIPNVMFNIALTYQCLGKYNQAMKHYESGLALREIMDDRNGVSIYLGHIASLFADMGNYHEAIDRYDKAIALGRTLGIRFWLAGYLIGKAGVLYRMGKNDDALSANIEGMRLAERVNNKAFIFQGKLLSIKIKAANFSIQGGLSNLSKLKEMLSSAKETYEMADLNYELYRFSKLYRQPKHVVEKYRWDASSFYQKLYQSSPNIRYKMKLNALHTGRCTI
ncbi:MAG: hypothetical protein B6244_07010 [Candidatus Cloacimonetes bacterium 4572_55]|nr:MAG: hypothetical protein B6244_07010 [Candidatus Cloacimonetes bacterium 4572_55]